MQNDHPPIEANAAQSASPSYINFVAALTAFKASNPERRILGDGTVVRQITQDEFLTKGGSDNQSDRIMDRQSGMTGWITEQGGHHLFVKIGVDSPYDLTVPAESQDTSPIAALNGP